MSIKLFSSIYEIHHFTAPQTTIPLPDPPPQIYFTAVPGDRVVLPCSIQPGAFIQYYSVVWSIKRENSIVVRVDTQNIQFDDSRYNIDRATYSLIIDPVNINDTNTHYGCVLYVIDPCTATWYPLQSSPPVSLSLHVIGKYYFAHNNYYALSEQLRAEDGGEKLHVAANTSCI